MTSSASFSRRHLFRATAVAVAAGSTVAVAGSAPRAHAQGRILGTVLDYSAGVPSAASVSAAGHLGAVRYVSAPRADWMLGKPVTLTETRAFADHGLETASVYQFGKDDSADWKRGLAGGLADAPQAIGYHRAAGGPTGRPIYIAIDDNPTRAEYTAQIRPYLLAFSGALTLSGYRTGIYGNYNVIDWAIADGIGEFFWQHNWGSNGRIHPRTTLHQVRIDQDTVDGVGVDINNVHAQDWGQWQPGVSLASGSSGSSVSSEQIQQAADLARSALSSLPR